MEDKRICPLKSGPKKEDQILCNEEECVFWCRWTETQNGKKHIYNDDCAIPTIAWWIQQVAIKP